MIVVRCRYCFLRLYCCSCCCRCERVCMKIYGKIFIIWMKQSRIVLASCFFIFCMLELAIHLLLHEFLYFWERFRWGFRISIVILFSFLIEYFWYKNFPCYPPSSSTQRSKWWLLVWGMGCLFSPVSIGVFVLSCLVVVSRVGISSVLLFRRGS